MYESHFHLNDRPFASVPNPEHYFPASSIEQAREVVALNVERGSGVTILMGPVGSGKTLLCQLIANQFSNELPVCMVQGGRIDTRELLLQSILHQLGLPFRGQDEGELRLILSDYVESQTCRNGFVLVIDEADRLPLELLEEVRALTNLVKEGEPSVRLVMAGGYPLEELVANPKLESLNQRVIGRLYLENFNRDETGDYIRARINACGGDAGSIFIDEACDTVFKATNGVPRLVNQVCDHAMLMASVGNIDQLRKSNIEEAWADLQQLPMPTATTPEQTSSSDVVVEFGSLDDEPDSDPAGQIDDIQRVVAELENEASEAVSIEIGGVEVEEEYHDGERIEIEFDSPAAASVEIEVGSEVEIEFGSDVAIVDSPDATVEFTQEATEVELTPDIEISSEVVVESDVEVEFEQQEVEAGEDVAIELEHEQEVEAEQAVEVDFESHTGMASVGSDETDDMADYPDSRVVYEEDSLAAEIHDSENESQDEFDPEQTVAWVPRSQYEIEDQQSDGEELESINEVASDDHLPERHSPFADELGFAETTDREVDVVEDDSQMAAEFEQHFVAANEAAVELTIEQATNPFEEEFADEEIVIQEFVSPSKIARGDFEHVSSAYSRRLAEQLTAAHPGLRMHFVESSEFDDEHESDDAERFEPLSAYLNDEPQAYADSSYAGAETARSQPAAESDPVMPDVTSVSIGNGQPSFEAAPSLAIHDPSWDRDQNESTEQSSSVVEEDGFEQPPSRILQPAREKVFRTLFSRMRRA